MASLFDPITIGDLKLANRIVMAPLTRNRSPHAVPNDLNVIYYEQRASAGLIITEATPISQQGTGLCGCSGPLFGGTTCRMAAGERCRA
ncbi:hypothetical protein B989_02268 [Brucella sp. 56/94]|nr:hypothetical protein B989_02268 [Brucella sp. 56/94]